MLWRNSAEQRIPLPKMTGEEQEFLQKFALICLLSFDVYMKKMIVEQLVADLADTMKAQEPEKEAHKKKNIDRFGKVKGQ